MKSIAVFELKDHLQQKIDGLRAKLICDLTSRHLELVLQNVIELENAGTANAAAVSRSLTTHDVVFLADSFDFTTDVQLENYLARKSVGFRPDVQVHVYVDEPLTLLRGSPPEQVVEIYVVFANTTDVVRFLKAEPW